MIAKRQLVLWLGVFIFGACIGAAVSWLWFKRTLPAKITEVDLFRIRHPDQFHRYALERQSVYALRAAASEVHVALSTVTRDIRRRFNDEKLHAFLEGWEEDLERGWERQINGLDWLEKQLLPTDEVFSYKYREGEKFREGILVLRNGNILLDEIQREGTLGKDQK